MIHNRGFTEHNEASGIVFDGYRYGVMEWTWKVNRFEGAVDRSAIPSMPYIDLSVNEDLKNRLVERGKKALDLQTIRYMTYKPEVPDQNGKGPTPAQRAGNGFSWKLGEPATVCTCQVADQSDASLERAAARHHRSSPISVEAYRMDGQTAPGLQEAQERGILRATRRMDKHRRCGQPKKMAVHTEQRRDPYGTRTRNPGAAMRRSPKGCAGIE